MWLQHYSGIGEAMHTIMNDKIRKLMFAVILVGCTHQRVETFTFTVASPIGEITNRHLIHEDNHYKFIRIGYGHNKEQEPGFYIFLKAEQKWIRIDKISTQNGQFGRSPTLEECRAVNKAPPSVGWDFQNYKNKDYVEMPLRGGSFISFPDKIILDQRNGKYILKFMSNWEIEGVETVLEINLEELQNAFK